MESHSQTNIPGVDAASILEAVPVGVLAIDRQGKIRLVNSVLEGMFASSRAEMIGQPIEALLPERFRGHHVGVRSGYWRDPTPRSMGQGRALYALRADGTEFPVEIGLKPTHTAEGMLVLAAVVDVSERKAMETTFESLVEATPFGMIVVNEDGRIALANGAVEKLLGYRRKGLLGESVERLLPERYRNDHASHMRTFQADPTPRAMGAGLHLTALHKNGLEVMVEILLTPIRWNGAPMTVASINDISAFTKMERELRQANLHLEEFTYAASHDLKSPLRGIANLADWIEEDLVDPSEEVLRNLARVKERIGNMARTIDDILEYARAGQATTVREEVDPPTLIADILTMYQPPDGFDITVCADVAPFMAAKTPIETVLRNLVDNAFKHHGGDNGRLRITVEDEGSYRRFTVADDGVGIPEHARERVFRMFQTAGERAGSGFGLPLCKRLVDAHGGRMSLMPSAEKGGTTFNVWWPRFRVKGVGEQASIGVPD